MTSRAARNRLTGKHANVTVVAFGQALFAPGTSLSNWKTRFSLRIREETKRAAPSHNHGKRPLRPHPGKPLKETFNAATTTRLTPGGGRFYIAVGSSAPHAIYVDQGTGVFGGNGPYEAKILPPFFEGSPSLYESTWHPGGRRVKPVLIKGQKGQGFFDTGLRRGFERMQMRSYQLPGEGIGGIASALASFPEGLSGFVGNTVADGAFIARLNEWRRWRDTAFRAGEELGRRHRPGVSRTRAVAARRSQAAQRAAQAAAKTAADARHAEQAKALARAKAAKAAAKAEREAKARVFNTANARRQAELKARALANRDYTGVALRTVFNKNHTEVIGFDVIYTDTAGHHGVKHFHV